MAVARWPPSLKARLQCTLNARQCLLHSPTGLLLGLHTDTYVSIAHGLSHVMASLTRCEATNHQGVLLG